MLGVIGGLAVVFALLTYIPDYLGSLRDYRATLELLSGAALVLLAVLGMLLLENLFRNADEHVRWAVKFLCFGLGAIFAYDFFLHAHAVLFHKIDPTLFTARGFVNALAVPLIAVSVSRSKTWQVDIHVSRKAVFHSAALLGSGFYLLLMSGVGFYVKNFGGDWGPTIQIIFFSGAVLILLVIFSSGSIRAQIRVWISKHFFSYKYDYREEWLRFIQTMSLDAHDAGLHGRIVRAIADIVDSTSGGLWVLRADDQAYFPTASWNFDGNLPDGGHPAERMDSAFVEYLNRTQWIVDLNECRSDPDRHEALSIPPWLLAHKRAWLVVPLMHRNVLHAFLVLGMPRANRSLDWEDYDLLKTIGRQTASYLAEEQAANALSDARRLEAFNRRFAFVIHDIKNLVSQMSLMLKNAERFGDNPQFQKDMLATVQNSVSRMRSLLVQFKAEHQRTSDNVKGIALRQVMVGVVEAWRTQKGDIEIDLGAADAEVIADKGILTSVLDHLLQNAIEAAGVDGGVSLRLRSAGDEAVIEVADDGPGMDEEFIRDQLFRPLDTAKESGYGLGAFQVRQLVRDMGGRLEVSSKLGKGTVMQVILPLAEPVQALGVGDEKTVSQ
jgi:putative PEP-CTERM system histidine kinase